MPKFTTGFTILELLVVLAIVTLIGSGVIFSYRTFTDRLAVSGAVQKIAIAAREAQTYGLSVRQANVTEGDFNAGYGIYFNITDPEAYYIFADRNNNSKFDPGSCSTATCDSIIEKGIISRNISITSICGTDSSGIERCPPSSGRSVSVVFQRPNPDAIIRFANPAGNLLPESYSITRIVLASPGSAIEASVSIYNTGQISTQ